MTRVLRRPLFSMMLTCAAAWLGCIGTTGDRLVTFDAAAAGPPDAMRGQPLLFTNGRGYPVTLTKAVLHVGALYLNQSVPVSGAQETNCVLPGTYVAQVTAALDVDLLDPAPQKFPLRGDGISLPARVGEVWLVGTGLNDADDATPILQVEGTVTRAGEMLPFEGKVTIGKNRLVPNVTPAEPGLNPLCKQRIVSPIPVNVVPQATGMLLLRIDVRALFLNVDFGALAKISNDPPRYGFNDSPKDQPSINLYQALRSSSPYGFSWQAPAP